MLILKNNLKSKLWVNIILNPIRSFLFESQKYRLHTRRPSPSPQAGGAPTPQLVVLGGIWVPPEYTTAATASHTGTSNALFSPHLASHAPLPHYCTTTPVPQDFYAAVPLQPQNHGLHHHNLNMYRMTSSHTQRSPEYEVRGGGERTESIEDVKSESIDSGENERERKREWWDHSQIIGFCLGTRVVKLGI